MSNYESDYENEYELDSVQILDFLKYPIKQSIMENNAKDMLDKNFYIVTHSNLGSSVSKSSIKIYIGKFNYYVNNGIDNHKYSFDELSEVVAKGNELIRVSEQKNIKQFIFDPKFFKLDEKYNYLFKK
jgi:hypothetical protein